MKRIRLSYIVQIMKKHLAIFSKDAIEQIFNGKKTIETRFSQKRVLPFGKVEVGDLIYIKPPGEDIVGSFKAKKIVSYEGLDKEDWKQIKQLFGEKLSFGNKKADIEFFNKHSNARFGTLIYIDNVEQFITSPLKIAKKDLRSWVIL